MLRSGKLVPWEASKHGKITTGSVAGPLHGLYKGSTCLFGLLDSCQKVLQSAGLHFFVSCQWNLQELYNIPI